MVESKACVDDKMKSFIQGILEAGFASIQTSVESSIERICGERLEKIEADLVEVKRLLSKPEAAKPMSVEPEAARSSLQETAVTSIKEKTKPTRQPKKAGQTKRGKKNVDTVSSGLIGLDELLMSQSSQAEMNLNTQEYLKATTGHLSQDTFVSGFDPTPINEVDDGPTDLVAVAAGVAIDKLAAICRGRNNDDWVKNPLFHHNEDDWDKMFKWCEFRDQTSGLDFGPTVINMDTLDRVMDSKKWFSNKDIDGLMYLFRENTSLGRWNYDRVAFMDCYFSAQMQYEYKMSFSKNRKNHRWSDFYLAYGNGELPAHGRTHKRWARDVDKLYAPVNVNGNHWIALCVDFNKRQIEIMDCYGKKTNTKYADPFKTMIPRIVKEVQEESVGKTMSVTPYKVINVPMQDGLNHSACSCGPYAVKHIELHLRGLDLSMLNDESMPSVRIKFGVDLWVAASDPVMIERILKYEPTKFDNKFDTIDIV